jgi:hypothetical protein
VASAGSPHSDATRCSGFIPVGTLFTGSVGIGEQMRTPATGGAQ